MTTQITSGTSQASSLSELSPARGSALLSGSSDFKAILKELYQAPTDMLKDFADPSTTTIDITGFGTLEKNSTATSLALGIQISRFDSQLTTLLNGLEFTLKTLPQKADSLWG